MIFADMNPEWVSHTVTGAIVGLVSIVGSAFGTYYYVRGRQIKTRGDEAAQRAAEDANTTRAWRELVDYKSEDFRKKNQEQDARVVAMEAKMDAMHKAHLDCERAGTEREIWFMTESAAREIILKQHEARIQDLVRVIEQLTAKVDLLTQDKSHGDEKLIADAVLAAQKVKAEAVIEADNMLANAKIEAGRVLANARPPEIAAPGK